MTSRRSDSPEGIPDDGRVVSAALRAFEHIERDGVAGELLFTVGTWCRAGKGWALVPAEEGPGWIPVRSVPPGEESAWEADEWGLPDPSAASWTDGPAAWRAKSIRPLGPGVEPGEGIVLPFRAADGGRPEAVLVLLEYEASPVDLLRDLIRVSMPVFRNARRVAEIRDLTIRDDTAVCFNRRHFEEFILEELARSRRFRSPLSLIFFDMDNLKEVNSRYGHAMGSRTLYEVSERVRGRIRRFDKLFRFGGDEFCIVLPETEWHGALEVAQRVRESVSAKPMLEEPLGRGKGVLMTASFGIASYPLHATSKEELVQTADRAMQSVKRNTKNGIAVAEMGDAPGT